MKEITANSPAILFETFDYVGAPVRLMEFKGKRVLLTFFRDASCPFCNIRLNQMIQSYDKFSSKGIAIIAFFSSSAAEIREYAGQQNPPFPIIPDPKFNVYSEYGVEKSFKAKLRTMKNLKQVRKAMASEYFSMKSFSKENVVPADFMISNELIIDRVHYGKEFSDHIPIEEVLNWKLKND